MNTIQYTNTNESDDDSDDIFVSSEDILNIINPKSFYNQNKLFINITTTRKNVITNDFINNFIPKYIGQIYLY